MYGFRVGSSLASDPCVVDGRSEKKEIPNAVWSYTGISNLQRTKINLKMKTSVSQACHPA